MVCELFSVCLVCVCVPAWSLGQDKDSNVPAPKLPDPGTVVVDKDRGEVILSAAVQFPEGKPCINEYGERIQAFAGCAKAAGGDAKMAAYFVFLVDVATEEVFDGLMKVGCRPLVHYSIQEGRKRAGLTATTPSENYLQGDPVVLSVFWKNPDGSWIERPYEHFVTEAITVDGQRVEKPWTPHFVFHGSLPGHTFPVYGAAFAPDGKTLATSSRDKMVRLWSLPGGKCRVLSGHTSDVHRCAYSPDGKLLASASQDGTVRVWDVQQGTCRQVLSVVKRGKPDPFYGVAFSPDGKRLAAVGDDFRLHIWGTDSFDVVSQDKLADDALYAVAFLPAQLGIAVAGAEAVVQLLSDAKGTSSRQ